ncbi:hypothetical protein GGH99_008660, partial [Coemansia sp. RSA 1285]
MGDKMSVSPREVELVDNMDDPYEICDLDDFDVDELQGFVDESQRLDNARSASNNSNDSGQGNGVSNLTSANATLAIDLCSDIDEDQVIDINDLDDFDDVGGTTLATSFSPKRFVEAYDPPDAYTSKRPRISDTQHPAHQPANSQN